jgi:hypothetical protein
MRYILYYKTLYIALLFLNLILIALWVEDFDVDSYVIFIVSHSFILLSINLYNFWKIKSFKVSALIYKIEIGISCYRLSGVISVASLLFSTLVLTFSPLTFSVWQPAFKLIKLDGGIYYWWLLLLIMFSLELYNLILLRRHKNNVSSNLTIK